MRDKHRQIFLNATIRSKDKDKTKIQKNAKQLPNFLGSSFSNGDNVRDPI